MTLFLFDLQYLIDDKISNCRGMILILAQGWKILPPLLHRFSYNFTQKFSRIVDRIEVFLLKMTAGPKRTIWWFFSWKKFWKMFRKIKMLLQVFIYFFDLYRSMESLFVYDKNHFFLNPMYQNFCFLLHF